MQVREVNGGGFYFCSHLSLWMSSRTSENPCVVWAYKAKCKWKDMALSASSSSKHHQLCTLAIASFTTQSFSH